LANELFTKLQVISSILTTYLPLQKETCKWEKGGGEKDRKESRKFENRGKKWKLGRKSRNRQELELVEGATLVGKSKEKNVVCLIYIIFVIFTALITDEVLD